MKTDAEADEIMRQWRDWFAASGVPDRLIDQRADAPSEIRGDGLDLAIVEGVVVDVLAEAAKRGAR